jgi:hypothetical protein
VNIAAIHRSGAAPRSGDQRSGTWLSGHRAARHLAAVTAVAGLILLASACASMAPRQASITGTLRRQVTAPSVAASLSAPAAAASRAAPAAAPATGTTGSPAGAVTVYTGPRFSTPRAAMTYMAAAYNDDNTTAMHAVTDPQAFTALLEMRSSDADLKLTSCRPTPRGDYVCSFRYNYVGGHDPQRRMAMVIAAPAQNPGWYMYGFMSGCD